MAAKSEKLADKKQNKFAYLDAINHYSSNDSSDSDEGEDSAARTKTRDISFITKPEDDTSGGEKVLPSPVGLFRDAQKPEFLRDKTKGSIEWSKYVKNTTVADEEEQAISSGHNVPPPTSYEPNSAPLKPTLGFNSLNTTKRKHGDDSG